MGIVERRIKTGLKGTPFEKEVKQRGVEANKIRKGIDPFPKKDTLVMNGKEWKPYGVRSR